MPNLQASRRACNRRYAALLAIFAIAAMAGCRTAPLVDPPPIAASETPDQTRVAVVRALMRNRWVVESERPGEIIARLDGRGWNIVVAVHYANQINLSYVSSQNLDYETSNGAARIHKGYNARVRKLSDEIGLQIAMQRATETPAVAAPPPATDAPR